MYLLILQPVSLISPTLQVTSLRHSLLLQCSPIVGPCQQPNIGQELAGRTEVVLAVEREGCQIQAGQYPEEREDKGGSA